jgi:hypothetical protein
MPLKPDVAKNLDDFSNALYEIQAIIEDCQVLLAKERRTKSVEDHMRAVFALSNLEIHMTNFATAMRERFK